MITTPVNKQKARVIGMVITDCPNCKNQIFLEKQSVKICPYCEAEVHLDIENIDVRVWALVPEIPARRRRRRSKTEDIDFLTN